MPTAQITSELKRLLAGPLRALADGPGGTGVRSAPGRVDVLGGLAVEAGGTLAQMAVPKRAAVWARVTDEPVLRVHGCDIGPPVGDPEVTAPMGEVARPGAAHVKDLAARFAGPAAWAAPLAALVYVLHQTPAGVALRGAGGGGGAAGGPKGITLVVHSALPMGAGQASSTAVLAAAVGAIAEAAGFRLDAPDAALIVHRAENLFRASTGHVVDALTCLDADAGDVKKPRVLRFSAQPHTLVSHTALPGDLRVMALDTGVRYTAGAETVGAIRLAGAMGLRIIETIYRDLGQRHTPLHGYLANLSPSLYRQYFRALLPKRLRGADFTRTYGVLPERAGAVDPKKLYRVRAAVDHLVTENEFAENFLQTIEELADPAARRMSKKERGLVHRRAGRLLLASHHSYSLRLELSCREADWLVDHLMEAGPAKGVFGARITGCGGGGTVAALLNRSSTSNDALLDTMNAYHKVTGLPLGVAEAGTGGSRGAE